MSKPNGEVCCLLGVCCPPSAQRAALASVLEERGLCNRAQAIQVARWVLRSFDLAPAGTLRPLLKAAVKHSGQERTGRRRTGGKKGAGAAKKKGKG